MSQTEQSVWAYDDLEINDEGKVEGVAYTHDKDGYDIQVGVFSYEYERHGETRQNHVPTVVVSDETGRIVAEPHAWDSANPEKAIENAKSTAEFVFENLSEYTD